MEPILRAAMMYLFLLIIIRVSGARTLSEMTTFDFVLLLIMGDASQQAITSDDYSVLNAIIVVSTLVILDVVMSLLKHKFHFFERLIDGKPVILVNDGEICKRALKVAKIDRYDILESARELQGLERLEQVKYAILEKDGSITVIPYKLSK